MSGCTPQSNVFHQAFGPGINGLLWWLSDVGGSGFIPETWVPSLGREGWDDPLEKEMALEYSCLGNKSIDRGAWRVTVHGVTKSRTQLSTHAKG